MPRHPFDSDCTCQSCNKEYFRRLRSGARFATGGGQTLTVNPTNNPAVPDGWYQTTTDSEGNKSTAVYNADGTMPGGKKMGDNDRYQ